MSSLIYSVFTAGLYIYSRKREKKRKSSARALNTFLSEEFFSWAEFVLLPLHRPSYAPEPRIKKRKTAEIVD